ncbi:hypothetical protein VHEMI01667 [[Torrubiella] hemipterigena]|uniref:Uncharacterized protein n=1 Tax=[Torrubiella] hemipterigena TaxID=1531966 RepID=A0A0A1STP6_9HYPO|nr:hypothetical protein VHEMI01667 [[Torrubiella] hemipterigena]
MDHLRPTLSSLRRLTIADDSFHLEQFEYLRSWLSLCSKLQTFLWIGIGEGHGIKQTDEIMHTLEPLGETLLKLDLNIHTPVLDYCEAGNFDPFKRLEALIIPSTMLCDCPKEPTWEHSVDCSTSLARLLPVTVKRLTVITQGPSCQGSGHAIHLGYEYKLRTDLQLKRLRMAADTWWNEYDEDDGSEVERRCSTDDMAMAGLQVKDAFALNRVKEQMTCYYSPIRYEGWRWCLTDSDDEVEAHAYTNSTVDEDSERSDESDAEV